MKVPLTYFGRMMVELDLRPSTLALDREDNLVVTVVLAAKVRHPSLAFDNYTLKQGTDFENIRPSNYMKY